MRFHILSACALLLAAACKPDEESEKEDPLKDTDGDGLIDSEEEIWGSDPRNPDSDDDGFQDGPEVDAGTHPVNFYSHPYVGGYNVGQCKYPDDYPEPLLTRDLDGGVYANGDAPENFYFFDQHEEIVDLYAFCGRHTMVVFGAGWCDECEPLAEDSQALQDEYGPEGFQLIWVLFEDWQNYPPETMDLNDWADDHQMTTIPVLSDGDLDALPFYEEDADLPTIVHIGAGMEILSMDEGEDDPRQWF